MHFLKSSFKKGQFLYWRLFTEFSSSSLAQASRLLVQCTADTEPVPTTIRANQFGHLPSLQEELNKTIKMNLKKKKKKLLYIALSTVSRTNL